VSQFSNASLYPAIGLLGKLNKGRTKEPTMATNRKSNEQRGRKKRAPRLAKAEGEDIALAEELLRNSRKEQAAVVQVSKEFLKSLGLEGLKPIGAKKLRERMIQEGFDPEGNEFSRSIIEMREE
jgi:hypothetical protein